MSFSFWIYKYYLLYALFRFIICNTWTKCVCAQRLGARTLCSAHTHRRHVCSYRRDKLSWTMIKYAKNFLGASSSFSARCLWYPRRKNIYIYLYSICYEQRKRAQSVRGQYEQHMNNKSIVCHSDRHRME